MGISEKLLYIQQNIKVPKEFTNEFGGFNYRNAEQILRVVKPLLKVKNVLINLSDSMEEVGGRVYVKATVTLTDVESGESLSTTAYAREVEQKPKMDAAQITGSASSYARKYALAGLLALDNEKDPDAMDNSNIVTKSASKLPELISAAEVQKLTDICLKMNVNLVALLSQYKVTMAEELTSADYGDIMKRFAKTTKEKK